MVTQDEKVIVKIEYTVKMIKLRSLVGVTLNRDNHYVCGLNTLLDGVQILGKKDGMFFI